MADFQIPDKDLLTSVDRAADSFLVYDDSGASLERTTVNYALDLTSHPVGINDVQIFTNKTLGITNTITASDSLFTLQDNSDNTKQAQFQLSGITTGTTRTYTLPNASSTLVDLSSSQTLTGKTLTSPTINTATIANPTLTVDTVSEFTAANGVTVDGLNIKDGKLNTANSVVATNITDAIITNAKLSTTAGEPGGVWLSWTPTFVNLSGGTLTYAKYTRVGKTIIFRLKYTLTGANVSGSVTFTPPVATNAEYATSSDSREPVGRCVLRDSGTATLYGTVIISGTVQEFFITVDGVGGTYATPATFSSTIPFTWASGDVIFVEGSYEAA